MPGLNRMDLAVIAILDLDQHPLCIIILFLSVEFTLIPYSIPWTFGHYLLSLINKNSFI